MDAINPISNPTATTTMHSVMPCDVGATVAADDDILS